MRATDGTTWLPIAESALRHRVRVETIKAWVRRNKVHGMWTNGEYYVCDDHVADAELAWRRRVGAA